MSAPLTALLAQALMFGGGTTLVAAQERLDLPRYSIEVPVGWSSEVMASAG